MNVTSRKLAVVNVPVCKVPHEDAPRTFLYFHPFICRCNLVIWCCFCYTYWIGLDWICNFSRLRLLNLNLNLLTWMLCWLKPHNWLYLNVLPISFQFRVLFPFIVIMSYLLPFSPYVFIYIFVFVNSIYVIRFLFGCTWVFYASLVYFHWISGNIVIIAELNDKSDNFKCELGSSYDATYSVKVDV